MEQSDEESWGTDYKAESHRYGCKSAWVFPAPAGGAQLAKLGSSYNGSFILNGPDGRVFLIFYRTRKKPSYLVHSGSPLYHVWIATQKGGIPAEPRRSRSVHACGCGCQAGMMLSDTYNAVPCIAIASPIRVPGCGLLCKKWSVTTPRLSQQLCYVQPQYRIVHS